MADIANGFNHWGATNLLRYAAKVKTLRYIYKKKRAKSLARFFIYLNNVPLQKSTIVNLSLLLELFQP